jgi:hypothetical protein
MKSPGREERRLSRRPAAQLLEHARGLLKHCDLLALWNLCARLSLHEALTRTDDRFCVVPTLNLEKVRMLCNVVLGSRAGYNQTSTLPAAEDFGKILNDCHAALDDPEEVASLRAASGTDRVYLEFRRFLARMGAVQISPQEPLTWERAGRAVAMLDVLPKRFPERIPSAQRPEVELLLRRVPDILGVSSLELGRGFADLLAWQHAVHARVYRQLVAANPDLSRRENETEGEMVRRQARLTLAFLELAGGDDHLVFGIEEIIGTLEQVLPGYAALARPRIAAFLRLAARSAEELRELLHRPEYQLGHLGKRLSPLERFPVVRLDTLPGEPRRYIVPNFRHFERSFAVVADFSLQEALGKDYEAARGALLHLYLRQLLEDRVPGAVVVPETRYDRARGGKDSPDLTLIEPAAGRIVGIEVKGRGINLATRLTVGDEELKENLRDAYDALQKLPAKIADLRTGRLEFAEWREAIAATGDTPPVLVVVVRGGLHFLSQLIREQVAQDANHPLAKVEHPYCLLSVDEFEQAVEVAKATGRSLADLLEQHDRRSADRDPGAPPPEWFGEKDERQEVPETFAASFYRKPEWVGLVPSSPTSRRARDPQPKAPVDAL